MSSPLILTLMTVCFLFFGHLGVPVPFSLMARNVTTLVFCANAAPATREPKSAAVAAALL